MIRRRLTLGLVLGLALLVSIQLARTIFYAWRDVHPPRSQVTAAEQQRARALLPGLEDVLFRTGDGIELRGWFSPGPRRTAVVLVHGLGGNRAELLPEAALLRQHGHGVLLFDSRASGESGGSVATWGDHERRDILAALDFISARKDVDPSGIGLYGFSVGATPVALVAAEDPRARAVALGPCWTSLRDELADKFRWRSARSSALAMLVFRLQGTDVDALRPDRAVGRIIPRPLLLMSGSEDPDTPPEVTRRLASLAPGAEVWIVPRARHGGYAEVDPVGLDQRFSRFFDRGLTLKSALLQREGGIPVGPGGPTRPDGGDVRSTR